MRLQVESYPLLVLDKQVLYGICDFFHYLLTVFTPRALTPAFGLRLTSVLTLLALLLAFSSAFSGAPL